MIKNTRFKSAALTANSTRRRLGLDIHSHFCTIDACRFLGLDVRLCKLDSVEAMYCKSTPPTIILSTSRPEFRRRFSCAHELGHWALGHSQGSIDLVSATDSSKSRPHTEAEADFFAAELLMPKLMLAKAIAAFGEKPTIREYFELSCAIGVGLSTLRFHLLKVAGLRAPVLEQSSNNPVQDVRSNLGIPSAITPLTALGPSWNNRPIDLDCGGFLLIRRNLEHEFANSRLLTRVDDADDGAIYQAKSSGVEKLKHLIRVMPADFEGRALFRHGRDLTDA